jgi:hypothetical protein
MSLPPAIPPSERTYSGIQVHSGMVCVGTGPAREWFAGRIGETVQAGATFLSVDTPEVDDCGPMTFLIPPSRVTLIQGGDREEVLEFWRSNNPKAEQRRIKESLQASLASLQAFYPQPRTEAD